MTAIMLLSFVMNIVFSTPSVRTATLTEIAPVAAAFPAANSVAALIVEDITEAGTPADPTFCESTAANAPSLSGRPTPPYGRGRETWLGRRPRHRGNRGGHGGTRPRPSGHAVVRGLQ